MEKINTDYKQNAYSMDQIWMLLLLFSGSQIDAHGDRENVPKDRQIPRDLQSAGPSRLVSQWILGESDLRPITAVWKTWEWEAAELKETEWSPFSASCCQPRVLKIGPAVFWLPGISVASVLFQNHICTLLGFIWAQRLLQVNVAYLCIISWLVTVFSAF